MRTTILILLLLALGAGLPSRAQDTAADDSEAAVTETADTGDDADEAASENDDPVIDLDDPDFADLDRQSYEEDDDDFVPTEEVPADEAIPFPTDI
jgi:hypothetical protein